MSYPYYEQDEYQVPQYPDQQPPRQRPPPSAQGRRPAPPAGYSGPPRGQAPMRPHRPAGPPAGGRFPVRPQQQPQQQYAPGPHHQPPLTEDSTEDLYSGSGYGEPEYDQHGQWPLSLPPSNARSQAGNSSNGGRRPPQRPQRPDHQQPIMDPPRARVAPANKQYHQPPPPPAQYSADQWADPSYSSPSSDYPPPNMPVPQPPYQQGAYGLANKRPPLGPPPSARRGPASYYPQIEAVHPIVEETDSLHGSIRNPSHRAGRDSSMKSWASSSAIPIGMSDYYLQYPESVPSIPGHERPISNAVSDYDEAIMEAPPPLAVHKENSAEDRDDQSPPLVRQASLGRKSRPTLTTVKSKERIRKDRNAGDGLSSLPSHQRAASSEPMPPNAGEILSKRSMQPPRPDPSSQRSQAGKVGNGGRAGGAAAMAAATATAPVYSNAANVRGNAAKSNAPDQTRRSEALISGVGLFDESSDSEKEKTREQERRLKKDPSKVLPAAKVPPLRPQRSNERSPLARELDPNVSEYFVGGPSAPGERLKAPTAGMSASAGRRRPPRLNVDAVREAEARGSLTSLPDLIKRATKLASNLDRGKTASRLGMDWFGGAAADDREKHLSVPNNRRSGSLSDILASFPPPGIATPPPSSPRRGQGMRGSVASWNRHRRHSHLPSVDDADQGKGRKRKTGCCGMPLWLCLLLLIILVLLVAAAIIVPVVLIVVPKQNGSGKNHSAANSALASCQKSLTCQNSGVNIITNSGGCQCLCVNGYTGSSCNTPSGAGCSTTRVGSMSDATVGSAIPRLLSGAQSNFSVPLDGQTLLGLFSGADMSCTSENALVTFNGNAGAKRSVNQVIVIETTRMLRARQATDTGNGAATSNGIVFQTGSPSGVNNPSAATSSAPPSSSSSSAALTSSSGSGKNTGTPADFARVAVLYVLQASGELDTAITAQKNLQTYLANGQGGSSSGQTNVTLGNGYSCDMAGHSIVSANGTTVGRS